MNEALALSQLSQFPPWHLQGEAFILNYWISPQFIRQYKAFRIAPSPDWSRDSSYVGSLSSISCWTL